METIRRIDWTDTLPAAESRTRMKAGLFQILGKTVSGVVVKERKFRDTPRTQVFLLFRDGTQLELYAWEGGFSCGSGLVEGDWRWTLDYMPDCERTKALFEVEPGSTPEGVPDPRLVGFRCNPELPDFVAEMRDIDAIGETERLVCEVSGGRRYSIPLLAREYAPVKLALGPSGVLLPVGGSG
jgi:hypothetical protein